MFDESDQFETICVSLGIYLIYIYENGNERKTKLNHVAKYFESNHFKRLFGWHIIIYLIN